MGTANRPALGRAEVSLTIDNSSGKLSADLAEVTITRTLFRSGDSEYSINGTPCRLLDIQELLSDTGVGRQQHVIISQGHLDAILEARPEDRRSVIEEAAGVLKYRRRRERAERRLASTEENLERLFDLVREVKRQIRPLERQAAAARSYTGLADELRAVRLHVAGSELGALDRQRSRLPPGPGGAAGERSPAPRGAGCARRRLGAHGRRAVGRARVRPHRGARPHRGHGRTCTRPLGRPARAPAVAGPGPRRRRRRRRGLDARGRGCPPGRRTVRRATRRQPTSHPSRTGSWRPRPAPPPSSRPIWRHGATAASCAAPRRPSPSPGDSSPRSSMPWSATAAPSTSSSPARVPPSVGPPSSRARTTSWASAWPRRSRPDTGCRPPAPRPRPPTWRPPAGSSWPRRRCARPSRSTPAPRPGPTPSSVPSTRPVALPAPSCWPGSTGSSARCSTSSRSTEGGRRPSRPPPGRPWPPWSCPAVSRRGPPCHGSARVGPPVQCSRSPSPPGPGASSWPARRRPKAPSPSGTTSGPGRAGATSRASTPCSTRSCTARAVPERGWSEAIDLALSRPDLVVVTRDGDRFSPTGWRVRAGGGVVTAAVVDEARERAEVARNESAAGRRRAHRRPGRGRVHARGGRRGGPGRRP